MNQKAKPHKQPLVVEDQDDMGFGSVVPFGSGRSSITMIKCYIIALYYGKILYLFVFAGNVFYLEAKGMEWFSRAWNVHNL